MVNELDEQWKDINEFPNYEISNFGNVRRKEDGFMLKPFINENGYFRISLTNENKHSKKFYVHRLVAIAFLPNNKNKKTVNHINNDCKDNHFTNLEWSTMKEQNQHKFKNNRKFTKRCNIKEIWRIDKDSNKKLGKYESSTKAAQWIKEQNLTSVENYLVLRSSITAVCKKITKNLTAYGFKWEYDVNEFELIENREEIWKDISVHFVPCKNYQISNFGNIKYKGKLSLLKPRRDGYCAKNIRGKPYLIHRLVAQMFILNPDNKPFVNHKDGNKSNNNETNLEWCTCLENNLHKIENNLSKTTKKVQVFNNKMEKISEHISIKVAAESYNFTASTVANNCNGVTYSTRSGLFFRFLQ